jgi:hypothetical protein
VSQPGPLPCLQGCTYVLDTKIKTIMALPDFALGSVHAITGAARSNWEARHEANTWLRTHIVKIVSPDGEALREVKVSDDPPSGAERKIISDLDAERRRAPFGDSAETERRRALAYALDHGSPADTGRRVEGRQPPPVP